MGKTLKPDLLVKGRFLKLGIHNNRSNTKQKRDAVSYYEE